MRPTARFSLVAVMIAVLFFAVVFVAQRYANKLWAGVTFTSVLVLLLTSTLAATFHTSRGRAFWVGFSLCGWTVFIVDMDIPYVQSIRFRPVDYVILQYSRRTLINWLPSQNS